MKKSVALNNLEKEIRNAKLGGVVLAHENSNCLTLFLPLLSFSHPNFNAGYARLSVSWIHWLRECHCFLLANESHINLCVEFDEITSDIDFIKNFLSTLRNEEEIFIC